jgi:uncharacterized membrane protein
MIVPLLAILIITASAGDIMLTHGMKRVGEIDDFRPASLLRVAWRAIRGGWVPAGVASMTISFFALLAALSAADVSLVIPVTAITYVLNTLGAQFFLKERVSGRRWLGAVLVAIGVALVSF